jgi:hypothetical protein
MFGGGSSTHLHKKVVISNAIHFDIHGRGTLGEANGLHEAFLR